MNEIQKVNENSVANDQQKSIFDPQAFSHMLNLAKHFSESKLIPQQFQNAPSDCLIAIQYAAELGINPLQFMQNSYIVHGKPGIESKLAIALANNSGIIDGVIQYKMEGDAKNRSCTAYAKLKNGDTISETVDMDVVRAEKWDSKPGSKWKTMPELMLKYRSAMFLIRTHFPQVIIGLQSKEELVDTVKIEKNITPHINKIDLSSVKPPEVQKDEVIEVEVVELSLNEEITALFKGLPKHQQEAVKQTQKSVKDMNDDEKKEMIEYLNVLLSEGE